MSARTRPVGLAIQEVSELAQSAPEVLGEMAGDLNGLLTTEDVHHLAAFIPPDNAALVSPMEHR